MIARIDQSNCTPDRSIVENVSSIRDVLELSRLFDLKLGLISLEQEKAFDRVEHNYLWDPFKASGFPPGFTDIIKVLYEDIEIY